MNILTKARIGFLAVLMLFSTTVLAGGAVFRNVVIFQDGSSGRPAAPLVRGFDGNFYGTAMAGGVNGGGMAFKLTPAGQITTIYSFGTPPNYEDGTDPEGMIQASDGNFYGYTTGGGTDTMFGTVFKLTPAGQLTTLHKFSGPDGSGPIGEPVQAGDGNFYGVTDGGGAVDDGAVFKMTPDGTLSVLYSFCSQPNCADGASPLSLMQASDGNLYGTTGGYGTVFKLTLDGTLTTIYQFCSQPDCADGGYPLGGVIQASGGNFYGTTVEGGIGAKFPCRGCGTVYRLTLDGQLTTLHNFDGNDGKFPHAGLVEATDGNFYGVTSAGGNGAQGTLFKIAADGTFTTLRRFTGPNGAEPVAPLIQSPNGTLWGTTFGDFNDNDGTIFAVNVGLGPFVEMSPYFGAVGSTVMLQGVQFARATSVSFNGIPAAYQIVNNYTIKAIVPDGATSGPVTVNASKQTLTSNRNFVVNPAQ